MKSQSSSTLDSNGQIRNPAQSSLTQSENTSQLRHRLSQKSLNDDVDPRRADLIGGDSESQNAYRPVGSQHFQNILEQEGVRSSNGSSEAGDGGRVAQKHPLSLQEKRQISHDMTQQSKAKHQEKVSYMY